MAVYYATRQYRHLGRYSKADQVKRWIATDMIFTLPGLTSDKSGKGPDMPSVASVLTIAAPNILLSSSLLSFLVGLGVYLGYIWTRDLDEDARAGDSKAVFITYAVGLGVCYFAYELSNAVVADQSYVSEWEILRDIAALLPTTEKEPETKESCKDNGKRPMLASAPVQIPFGGTHDTPSRQERRTPLPDDLSSHELLQVFREAAELRKASTELDERLAKLLERLV
jgi:hypothetical protein